MSIHLDAGAGGRNESVSMKQLEAVTELTYNIHTELKAITFHVGELPFT
jgi:hypothetical protein